jgi:hypothetical protein
MDDIEIIRQHTYTGIELTGTDYLDSNAKFYQPLTQLASDYSGLKFSIG